MEGGAGWTALLPFTLLLAVIAIFPAAAPRFWHGHYGKVSAALAAPTALWFLLRGGIWHAEYLHAGREYVTFVLLLAALYVTTGGVFLRGNLPGTPMTNLAILAAGAVLASLVGTTGSSMLLVRPLLRANQWREDRRHLVIFFIFVVSNIGGCLTPLGDPPLFLGFLKGVPFGWTFNLFREWLAANAVLLFVFWLWDARMFRREAAGGRHPPHPVTDERMVLVGAPGIVLTLLVLAAVLMQGTVRLEGGRSLPWGVQEGAFAALIFLSLKMTEPEIRRANRFTWHPIREVAILFAAIFTAMVPALVFLRAQAPSLGIAEPWQFFWATGLLSAFLDNAPTYLTFVSIAQGLPAPEGTALVIGVAHPTLVAISCGAVFMGAMTYIGNAPNFMVKAIAEESGVPMPGFFGYLAWSAGILLPVFAVLTLVFFL